MACERRASAEQADVNGETEDERPVSEGGWSWLVVIAVALNKMAFWGALPCFALLFDDVLRTAPGHEGAAVATIIGVFTVCLDSAGFITPALYRRFAFWHVGCMGGLIYLSGSVLAAFALSVTQLIVCYGFVQGVGFGLMMNAGLATFNEHFRRRRTTAMAVVQCTNGAASLALPLMAQAVQASAGARAAKLSFVAFSVAAAASQLLLRAQPPDPRLPAQPLWPSPPPPPEVEESDCPDKNILPTPSTNSKPYGFKRAAWSEAAARARRAAWRVSGLDRATVRAPRVLAVAAGVSLVHVAEPTFFAMLPLHLRAVGLDPVLVARAVSAANAGHLAGCVALALAGRWLARRNRCVFAASAAASAVIMTALSFVEAWPAVLSAVVVLGVCKGMLYVTFFLTIAEVVPQDKFPSAVAVHFCMQVVLSMVLAPLLGLVRDVTGSFPVTFCAIALLLLLCPALWGLHLAGERRARTRRPVPADTDAAEQLMRSSSAAR